MLLPFPVLLLRLSYGSIPMEMRHKRKELNKHYNRKWELLIDIDNWKDIDLSEALVRTNMNKLIDPEIVQVSPEEQVRIIDFYKNIGRFLTHFSKYMVRDNDNGIVYLPQDIFVLNVSVDETSSSDCEFP